MKPPTAFFMLLAMAACASAQVTLSTVEDGVATPVGQAVSFGSVAAGWDVADVVFNISYTGSATTYYLTYFNLQQGTPFSVAATDWASLPATVPAGGLNFTLRFQPNQVAQSYSATLNVGDADNPVTVVLIGQSVPGFTVVAANQPLSAGGTVGFASVPVGSSQTVLMTLANQTSGPLTVGAIAIQGAAFQLTPPSPAGAAVASGSSAELQLVFSPTAAGPQEGTLTIGVATFPLNGTGTAPSPPVLPAPSIQLTPATLTSAQQGSLSVNLASPSASSGIGTVTLTGLNDDPAVSFADGTRSAAFTVAVGASTGEFAGGPSVSFGTGTTAGTLTFTVTLGSNTPQTTNVTIPAALVGIDAAVATRNVACDPGLVYCTTTNVQVQVNGWDNTRSASQVVFTFFDSSGDQIAPGPITVAAATPFQQYFAASDMAGVFGVTAFFPVTGDADDVVAAVVQIANSVGVVESMQITF
jgi:hypothetical protein